MFGIEGVGRLLIVLGLFIASLGLILVLAGRLPLIGHLPGDLFIRRGNTTIWLPIVTSIILSILLSLILTIIAILGRR